MSRLIREMVFRLGRTRWDVIVLVIADRSLLTAESQTSLHGLEQFANDVTIDRYLDLDALVAFEVDDGEGLAGFVEDVLGNVLGALVAFRAKSFAFEVSLVRMSTGDTVRSVTGERFHDVELVVTGKAGVSGRYGREADLADCGRHDRFK